MSEKKNEQEINYTNHSLYNCLIITLNLNKFLEENSDLSKNNNL